MIHSYKTEVIILKRKNFGEADRLLTGYSSDHGKLRLIAKGVRRTTSRKAPSLELFNHCRVFIAKGRNLDLITEIEVINSFNCWRKDLLKVGVAYYFCELIDKLTVDNQENQPVFNLLCQSLKAIDSDNLKNLVNNFEKSLLKELGFGNPSGDIRSYIESLTEKPISTPKIIRRLTSNNQ